MHFPATEAVAEDADIEPVQKESHKRLMVQQHSLHIASMAPTLFSHCVESSHVKSCLQMLVKPAFVLKDDGAQFKLFSLVLALQKLKVQQSQKGFNSDG